MNILETSNANDVHVNGLRDIARACSESNVSRLIHVSPATALLNSKSIIMKSCRKEKKC